MSEGTITVPRSLISEIFHPHLTRNLRYTGVLQSYVADSRN
jgi:hypothetical protein